MPQWLDSPATFRFLHSGGSDPKYPITEGINYPDGLALDSAGDLGVTNAYGGNERIGARSAFITPVSGDHSAASNPLTDGNGPGDPVFGPSGELYVASGQEILVLAKDGERVVRTIRKGLASPTGLTFDGNGILYVANPANSTITEYVPGSVDVLRTIPGVKAYPYAIAFGPS